VIILSNERIFWGDISEPKTQAFVYNKICEKLLINPFDIRVCYFLTGPSGSGKSFLLRKFAKEYLNVIYIDVAKVLHEQITPFGISESEWLDKVFLESIQYEEISFEKNPIMILDNSELLSEQFPQKFFKSDLKFGEYDSNEIKLLIPRILNQICPEHVLNYKLTKKKNDIRIRLPYYYELVMTGNSKEKCNLHLTKQLMEVFK